MVNQQIAMARWLRWVLVGLLSLFSLGLVPSGAVATPAQAAVPSTPMVQPDGAMSDGAMSDGAMSDGAMSDGDISDGATSYPVIPKLTNPAEIPVAETPTIEVEPSLTSSLAWLHEAIKGTQSPETENDSRGNGNATVKQWLSSINSVLEGK